MNRQVASSEVLWYAADLAAAAGLDLDITGRLIAGTPAWCATDDGAAKLLAVVAGGVREAIAHEARQIAAAEASKAVAGAADWPGLGREIHGRAAFRATRPWARRIGGVA